MRHNKHGKSWTRLYALLCVPLLVLTWPKTWAQTAKSLAELELNDDNIKFSIPDAAVQITVISTPYTISFSVSPVDKDKYSLENVTCPVGSGKPVDGVIICENLEPCTIYTIIATLRGTGADATPFDQVVVAYTDYKDPNTTLTSVLATETSIMLTWNTTDRSCVNHFEIMATAADISRLRQKLKEESSDSFDDVWPCRNYNVTLITRNNASVLVDSDARFVETGYLEPGELKLTIANRTNSDTLVKWKEPVNKSCIGSFTIVWRRNGCVSDNEETTSETTDVDVETTTAITGWDDESTTAITELDDDTEINTLYSSADFQPETRVECEWSEETNDSTVKQFIITELQGCALHTIEVYINMDRNTTAKATETFISGTKIPSAVSQARQNVSSTDLLWSWSPPSDHAQCVANYRVNLTGPTQRKKHVGREQLTNETFVFFDRLEPCGIYNVQIVPISSNGSMGGKYRAQSILSEDQPTQILEPLSYTEPFAIKLSWQTPNYADLCIDGYRLSGWMEDGKEVDALSVNTNNNSVLFEKDVMACQAYTIQIIPYTRKDFDGELRQIEVETQAAVVGMDKVEVNLVRVTSHSVELNANDRNFDNNCQTFFALFSCSTGANVHHVYAEKYVESHRDNRGFQTIVAPLSPYVQYKCIVYLYNVAGVTEIKAWTGLTLADFPEQPVNVTLDNSTKHSLTFTWEQPRLSNGPLKYYQAFLMRYEADYFVPSTCATISEGTKTDTKGDMTNTFYDLAPAVKYIMQVAAQNDFGLGQYTAPFMGITKPDVADPVTDLNVISEGPSADPNNYSANVTITWSIPCKSNGHIEWFFLVFNGKRNEQEFQFQRQVPSGGHDKKGRMSYTETDLQPEVDYAVNVAVKTRNVITLSASVKKEWKSPSGLPSGLGDDVVRQMRVSAYETSHPTSSAIVRLPANILYSESGNITYLALLLSQKSCTGSPVLKYDVLNSDDWPSTSSWDEVSGDCIHQYQTTPERWKPFGSSRSSSSSSSRNRRAASDEEIIFTIGVDKCPDQTKRYCNGPLNANTEYNLVVRLFTRSGYNDAALLEFKTDAAIKVTLILVSVCSCLLMAFVLGLLVLWVRKRIAWHRDSGQGIEDPFGNVIAKNFAIFYAEVAKPEKLAREFKEITIVALELSYSASELGTNKNRYADIYPYDKNRVILDIDSEGSDYINASFIDGHSRKKEYIATQGPKPESVMDFWRMILQHNVRVIVQVTQFREGNTVKCHEYYPYNMRGVTVTIKSKECFEIYDRTEFCVVHEKYGLKEKVIHFFFKKWPDHGCPDDPSHLITFVKKVKAEKRPNYSPIVVHCSAGVGRTGTFIGLDLIMQRLKSESKINIFETVKKLRFQRMKMVQTQLQYTFLYSCTYELVKHKIPRAALKLDGRPKTNAIPPLSVPKKVSFPDTDMSRVSAAVLDIPDPDLGENDKRATAVQLLSRCGGLRRTKDLDSLYEQTEWNGHKSPNVGNGECAI